MQSIFLNYYQRVILSNMIGAHSVQTLGESATYLRLLEKLRLSDQEITESEFILVADRSQWRLPSMGYGDRTVSLENTEAEALAKVIGSAQGVRVADAQWLTKIVEQAQTQTEVAQVPSRLV
jgi:hypothetical protein